MTVPQHLTVHSRQPQERDRANALYDQACSPLAAAQGLRAAAGPRRSAPAIAASLGCLEASLEALGTAVVVMSVAALPPAAEPRSAGDRATMEALRIRAGFAQLSRDLSATRSSCAAVRQVVGPVVPQC